MKETKPNAEELLKRYSASETEKQKFRTLYQDVYDYGMPSRYPNIEIAKNESGQSRREDLYSSVFEQASDEFVQRIQSLLAPVNSDWIDFDAGYLMKKNIENDAAKTDEVNKKLADLAHTCNVFKNVSNFDSSFTEFCYDLVAGTAVLCVLRGDFENPLTFVAVPFRDLNLEEGINGEISAFFRKLSLKNKLVKSQWTDIDFSYDEANADKETCFIEAVYQDETKKGWWYVVIEEDKKKILLEKKQKTSPYVDLRWSKCSGETYGRGVGLKVINDVKTLNKLKEYSLRALAFTVPVFTGVQDTFDASQIDILPGAIIPVNSNDRSNPSLTQLEVGTMPDLQQYNINQLEMDIKRGMLASTIPNDASRQLTATEINQRVAELQQSLTNSFGRLLSFLRRLIQRMIEVLQEFGYISPEIDVAHFNGFGYKVKINTMLAAQQTKQETMNVINAMQIMQQFDPEMRYMSEVIKMDEIIPNMLDKLGVENKFIRTQDEIKQIRMAQAQAQMAEQERMAAQDVEASNAKEMGKENAKQQSKSI